MKWFIWVSLMLVGALGFFKKDEAVLHPEVEKVLSDAVPAVAKEEESLDDIISRGQKP